MSDAVRLINHAEDYINANLERHITLDDLAADAMLSKFHFHRLFSLHSHETLKQFIIRIKMERSAMFLMIRTDVSLTEIAHRYGYSEASAYSRAFKKHFGVTPSAYRSARNVNT